AGDALERLGKLVLRVAAEEAHRALVGADQAEQHPHRRRLPRAVRAEKAVDIAALDRQVDGVDGNDLAVPLGEPARLDRSRIARCFDQRSSRAGAVRRRRRRATIATTAATATTMTAIVT